MTTLTTIGYCAGTLSSLGFVPQVIKGFRTKHMKDVALWQPLLLTVGMILWLIYGIMLKEMPMILANTFAIICNAIVIVQKLIYK
jgi:MtN3 and saliva related transmembrane protein